MPTIDPYAGTPEEFTESMWKEFAANWRTGGENVFNKRSGEAGLSGHIPSTAIKAAMRYFLGYEQVQPVTSDNPGSKYVTKVTLCRKNPLRHPYFENLWCSGVGELEFKPISPYVPGVGAQLKLPTKPVPVKTAPAIANRTGYNRCKLTLKFSPLPYDVLEDDDANESQISAFANEWLRNVSIDTEPRFETFEPKVPIYFTEGTGFAPGAGYSNPKGVLSASPLARIVVKPDVILRWYNVPHQWIMTPGTSTPGNLLAGLGCVNSGFYANSFLKNGYVIGTLLLVGVKLTKYPWTLLPAMSLPGASTESKFLYDVELMCSYFDPIKGFTNDPVKGPVQITTFRGHNCDPYPGAIAGAVDGNSNLWFYV